MPAFRMDASNTAAEQAAQAGMHHDGIEFFPLPLGSADSARGLLAMNHEYTDDGLLHPDGTPTWSAEKVRKAQAAHGVSVIEVRPRGGGWRGRAAVAATRGASPPTRRCAISGPAAGPMRCRPRSIHPAARCSAPSTTARTATRRGAPTSPARRTANGYFVNAGAITAEHRRYGITAQGARLPLARVRRALRRRRSTRTSRTASAGWSRSIPTIRIDAGEAHRARPLQARGRASVGRGRRARRRLHGRRRALRVHLQVRVRAPRATRRTARRTATCSTTARSTSRGSTTTAPATGSRSCTGRTASPRRTASRARPTC